MTERASTELSEKVLKEAGWTRPKTLWVSLLSILIIFAIFSAAVTTILTTQNRTLEDEMSNLKKLSFMLSEYTYGVIFSADLLISSLEEQIASAGITTPEEYRKYVGTEKIHWQLMEMLTSSVHVDTLGIEDVDGIIRNNTRKWPTVPIDVSGREYFIKLRDNPTITHTISDPILSKVTGQEIIILGRRITAPDGTFLGIIVAVISTSRFDKTFASILNDNDIQASLFRKDGTLLSQEPRYISSLEKSAEAWKAVQYGLMRGGGFGIRTDLVLPELPAQLIASYSVRGYPLLISVTKNEDIILSKLQGSAVLISIISGVVALLVGFLTIASTRISRKSAEQADILERALRKEKQYSALQQKFVSLVSHEFRTPLAIIDGTVQRIIRTKETITPEQLVERGSMIRSSIERLVSLIETTLYASRIDAGKIKINMQSFNVRRLIAEVCARQGEISPSHDIRIDLGDIPKDINADNRLLEHIFTNLLSNACKYAPDNPLIEVGGKVDGGEALITIKDQGVGISENDLPHIFERYFRANTATGIKGTGLGLSVCKEFIEMHSGTIEAFSVEGEGSTFVVRLPINVKSM